MTRDRDDDVPIQVDGYRIRVKARPAEDREARPETWREVGRRVNQHLMTIASGIPGLVADVVEGASNIVRGIARLPSALARRVGGGHDLADAAEGRAQDRDAPALPPDEAIRQLQAVMKRIQVTGLTAEIVLQKDGTPVVIAGRPELKGIAGDLAGSARSLPPATDEVDK